MTGARIHVSAAQIAEMQGIAEQLREHSSEVEELLRAGIVDRITLLRLRARLSSLVVEADAAIALIEAQAGDRFDLTELRRLVAELRLLLVAEVSS